ncbi:hypothetical protein FDG2_4151 [Candidatus Protofrankia californiensis]|uniref:Glyoxalase/fosfomycin resistance/dioxygenase domain-containing protein n=1 Tax=Candidatus Protofrankia californiensis TaxID=1839754 RepID=A0A1C3P3M6_9ACTN|nr:hypothetical protein FDG2_4151 [Candidatus Protofrankia californiensis]
MDITIHWAFLPHSYPDASLAFYRDILGFEVRNDGYGGMRWITVGCRDRADEGEPDVLLEAGQIEPGDADGDREGGPA